MSKSVSGYPTYQPIIQRKPGCPCGGGCPRCKEEPTIQAKLRIGAPNDKYEQEAHRVAEQVMRMPEPQVQRELEEEVSQANPLAGQTTPVIQRQLEEEEEEELIQAKPAASRATEVTPAVANRINTLSGDGQPLDQATRAFMEPRFGRDFGDVRVHTGSKAARTAGAVEAQAFTLGKDIVFGAEKYVPETNVGRQLLAHELTHVIQQNHANHVSQIQKSPGPDPAPEKENEDVSLGTGISSRYEIILETKKYVIRETANPESWGTVPHDFQKKIEEFEGTYPNLGTGLWAFILDQSETQYCPIEGNCLGYAKAVFGNHETTGAAWNKMSKYVESMRWKVLTGGSPKAVYEEKVKTQVIQPLAIWDYFMKVDFNAIPVAGESEANLALYGRGFGNQDGPSHIAFRPKGGNLWFSKPSPANSKVPVLHQSATQMSGGEMGDIIRYYKSEAGPPFDKIYIQNKQESGPNEAESTTPNE